MESRAIANSMEILETKPLNDLVTEAVIKVCYVSELANPNGTVIDKEVGKQIAATLPGAPVVGLFDKETNDFVEHSRRLIVEKGEIIWEDLTKPYGFVDPIGKPWYQDFMENGHLRKYLMCKAYLWTRQYKEASLALNKGQSMELNEEDMKGFYDNNVFIFTKATLDKLCILGDAYAPCFEGAKIMTTYSRLYNDLAAEVEHIIGRRYYVLNGELAEKPKNVTLQYALDMGWNLSEAVQAQMHDRGIDAEYCLEGIYSEGSQIFVILKNMATTEMCKVNLEITEDERVVLDTEMVAVVLNWTPKKPINDQKVESLTSGKMRVESVPTALPGEEAAVEYTAENPIEEGVATMNENETNEVQVETPAETVEEVVETVEEVVEATAETAEEAVADTGTEGAEEGASTEEVVEEAAGEVTEVLENIEENTTENVEETFEDNKPAEGENENTEEATEQAPTDFAELSDRIAALEQTIAERDATIADLESQLNTYRLRDQEIENSAKNEMVSSYRALLTEEEMRPVTEKLGEFTLEQVEAKLAVTYSRKQKKSMTSNNSGVQVNIGALAPDDDNLPDFMAQAIAYDRAHGISL